MKYINLKTVGTLISLLFMTGCSMSDERVYPQNPENISKEDIEIYQKLQDDGVDVERYKEDARYFLKQTFNELKKTDSYYDDKIDSGKDRFTEVIQSYNKEKGLH